MVPLESCEAESQLRGDAMAGGKTKRAGSLEPNIEKQLKQEQQQILLRDALAPLVISVLALLLVWVLMSNSLDSDRFKLWFALGSLLLGARGILCVVLRRTSSLQSPRLEQLTKVYTMLLFLSGMLWGGLILFWDAGLPLAAQLQLFLFPIAMTGGAVASYGTVSSAYLAFLIPSMLPVIWVLAFASEFVVRLTALPATLYLAGLVVLCFKYQARLRDAISLRLKNERLVENLSTQNEELLIARDEAEAANRSKSEFLARMSHEIRTPINGVLGMTQVLQGTPLVESQKNITDTIFTSGESLLHLINDLLDVSKIEAGKFELERVDFNLSELLTQISALLGQTAQAKSVALTLKVEQDVPVWVNGDPVRLKQILTNLVANAVKFTERGSVKIFVELAPESCEENLQLNFLVKDSGIGISEEKLELIFDAFTQADGTTTRKFGGTGLGLSIARQLAELMDGSIEVESEQGVGSEFTLTVSLGRIEQPVEQEHTDEAEDDVLAGRRNLTGILDNNNVLLVEDNIINQQVALAMLESADCQVTLAEDGSEAVDAVKVEQFDVILMDCQMPVMDGYEATRQIRKIDKNSRTPIIAITANAMDGDKERCIQAGMNDYLSKPFKLDDLHEALSRWV